MKEKYLKVLNLFVSDNNLNVAMLKPFLQENSYIATCGHTLCLLEKSVIDLDISSHSNQPNALKVIPSDNNNTSIEVQLFSEELKKVPLITNTNECDECGGGGDVTCEYGHDHECPTCEGYGKTVIYPIIKIQDPECYVKIQDVWFRFATISRVLQACNILELTRFEWIVKNNKGANLFLCGDFKILIMSCLVVERDLKDNPEKTSIKITI